ncbi:Squalene epoxidase [Puccinia graminis f. sp. tritici]|uniref:Squalene monooxygenase n=1 Tax=Puccinia graminis f. sp. tritici TaxID=56615 RepID=A0A5B0P1A9_PUCGR|nr:Squalene epoxidase [Puccinia graminis f. sp. tritici]
MCFSVVKSHLRRTQALVRAIDEIEEISRVAAMTITPELCEQLYRHAGYSCTQEAYNSAVIHDETGKSIPSVLLIERDLRQPDRIVGEILQPGGCLAVKRLGLRDCLDEIEAVEVNGYGVYWGTDASQITQLAPPYPPEFCRLTPPNTCPIRLHSSPWTWTCDSEQERSGR